MTVKKLLPVLVIGALALPVFAAEKQTVQTLSQELEVSGVGKLMIDFPVGDLALTGTDTDKIKVNVDIRCAEPTSSACRRVVEKAKIDVSRTAKGLALKVEGWPKRGGNDIELAGRIEIPKALNLVTELEVGDLDISGLSGDVDVDVEVGDVKITAMEEATGQVNLDSGVGEATLKVKDSAIQGDGLVGQDLKWTGKGKARIVVDVNVGDIVVTLD